ncbi:MAG TPA: GntR family transcriptional regulator [Ilumatobacteraceae bacterium]|nr:GntR family transcriptional regulator [Ilumatobacteraceae bacterium]
MTGLRQEVATIGGSAKTPVGVAHQPLRVVVRDEIRRRIIAGSLPQGDRILEDQLAQELGVSRNPVREALQTLAREGFVEIEPRRGARVMVLSDDRAAQLFEVREPLEGLVAGLAAIRRTDEQLREMHEVVDAGRTCLATGDMTPLPTLNTRFHRLVVESAGNDLLIEVLDGLTHVIEWMYTRRVRERGLWSWGEHNAITARIAERDRDGARAMACTHIRNARDAYFAALAP